MTGDDPKPTAASITAAAANQFLEERDRARHLAKHLFQMIPPEVWREQGGDDGQGHYEGDYWAAELANEIRGWEHPNPCAEIEPPALDRRDD